MISNRNVLLLKQTILDSSVIDNVQVVSIHFRSGVNIDAQKSQHIPERNNLLYSMANCHKLGRIGGGFHYYLSFNIVEHRSSIDKHDDTSNGSASYLIVSMVGIHKHSNRQLFNQWQREILVNLFHGLRVLFLEVFHKFGIMTQVYSCDDGVSGVHHYPFVWVIFQVAKHPQGTFKVTFPWAGSEER